MELELSPKQALTPSLQTSMRILQMNNLQLRGYIGELMTNNAAVELAYPEIEYRPGPFEPRSAPGREVPKEQLMADKAASTNVRDDLLLQCAALCLPRRFHRILQYLILSLDERGYLAESPLETARLLRVRQQDVEKCVLLLQKMEPAGIGAANLQECLRLQLERAAEPDRLALEIAARYLEPMARMQYGAIAKALCVPRSEVARACEKIRALNPKPLNGLGSEGMRQFILPDFYVVEENGQLHCQMNDYYLPEIRLDPSCHRLLKSRELDSVDREYLQKNVRQAQEVIEFLEYRKATLSRVVEAVLVMQEEFFRMGPGHRKAMSNRELAQALALHESTVSRAVSGKFFECKWGVFPLKSLFMHTVKLGEEENFDQILQQLQELIRTEPLEKPLSDQQLANLLGAQGVQIARRTVAKYRQRLGIPPAGKRRGGQPPDTPPN